MKIPFTELIEEFNVKNKKSGKRLTKKSIAIELSSQNLFKTVKSAENMIRYNESGKAQSIDRDLYFYCLAKFNKKGSEVIVF